MKARTGRARMAIAGLIGSAALAGPVTAALSAGQVVNAQPSTPKDTSDAVESAVTTAVTTPQFVAEGTQDQAVQGIFGQLTAGQPTGFQQLIGGLGNPPAGNPLPFDGLSGPSPAAQGLAPLLTGGTQFTGGTLGMFQLAALPPGAPTDALAPPTLPPSLRDFTIPLNVYPYPGDPNVINGGFSIVLDPVSGIPVLKYSTFDGTASITYQPGDAVVLPGGTTAVRAGTDGQGNPVVKFDPYPYPVPTYVGPTRGADNGTDQTDQMDQPVQVAQNTNTPATDPPATTTPPATDPPVTAVPPPADPTQQPPQADPAQPQPPVNVASQQTDPNLQAGQSADGLDLTS